MSEISILSQTEKVSGFARGYRATHVIDVGLKFGMLEALAEARHGLTASELALKLMLYEPYIRIWCQTAYHFEIIDGDETGRFWLQPFMSEILGLGMSLYQAPVRDKPACGDYEPEEYESPLSRFIRSGLTIKAGKTPDASFATYRGTVNVPTIFLSMIFPGHDNIKSKLEQGVSFLDIGCGSGHLIIEFARAFKNSTFVGVDPDYYGLESAEKAILDLGLENRVTVEDRGGEEMPFQEEFDLASMVLTLHEIQPDIRAEAVFRAYQALKKGGRLLILDYPYPERLEDFRNPTFAYGVIEQYFEAANDIVHLSAKQQDELLLAAGFKDIKRTRVGNDKFDFILASK